jgi:hypothetical protein
MIDIRTLDWQPNPQDPFAARAYIPAGERRLRLDAHLPDFPPEADVIEALLRGNAGLEVTAFPMHGDEVVVTPWLNSGRNPGIPIRTDANCHLAELVAAMLEPSVLFLTIAEARRVEAAMLRDELLTLARQLR